MMDLSRFKKVKEDAKSATLRHPAGHTIRIAKGRLTPDHKDAIERLPLCNGGQVQKFSDGGMSMASSPDQGDAAPIGAENINSLADAEPNASFDNSPAPQPQPENFMTNGTFDTDKFVLSHPDVPVDAKLRVLDKMKNQEDFAAAQAKASAAAEQQKVERYNKMAAARGLPLIAQPDQGSAAPSNEMPEDFKPKVNAAGAPDMSVAMKILQDPNVSEARKGEIIRMLQSSGGGSPQGLPSATGGEQSNQPMNLLTGYQGAMSDYEQGVNEEAAAQGKLGQDKAAAIAPVIQQNQEAINSLRTKIQDSEDQYRLFMKDAAEQKIDPKHYLNSMGVGQKIATGIGLILGGMGGGLTHQENPALKYLNAQIDRDIEGQKMELGQKQNLLSANMSHFHNLGLATEMTRAMQQGLMANKIELAAAKSQDPIQKARAKQAVSQFHMASLQTLKGLQFSQQMMDQMNQPAGAGVSSSDQTAKLINYMRVVNPEMAKSYEQRFIPGVGLGAVPIPDKARDEVLSRQNLDQSISDLKNFATEHGGDLSPNIVAQGAAKARLVQDQYRRANNQGVFREAEKDFVEGVIDEKPTKFFANYRTIPKYQEAMDNNLMQLNSLKKNYGLPVPYQTKSATKR